MEPKNPTMNPASKPLKGKCVIALEDDPQILGILSTVLSNLGANTVLTATSCAHADGLLGYTGDIHLIITDVNLGPDEQGRNGFDLIAGWHARWPDAKIIVASGGHPRMSQSEFDLKVQACKGVHLQKPFMLGRLIRTIETMVGDSGAPH